MYNNRFGYLSKKMFYRRDCDCVLSKTCSTGGGMGRPGAASDSAYGSENDLPTNSPAVLRSESGEDLSSM